MIVTGKIANNQYTAGVYDTSSPASTKTSIALIISRVWTSAATSFATMAQTLRRKVTFSPRQLPIKGRKGLRFYVGPQNVVDDLAPVENDDPPPHGQSPV